MTEPPIPAPGQPLLPWARRIWAALRASRPIAGRGIQLQETPSGTIISTPWEPPASTSTPFPFQVLNASTPDDGQRVYIRPGMISSINDWNDVPSNMVADDSDPADKLHLPVTAGGFILLKITGEAGEPDTLTATITDATVIFHAGDSPPDDVPLEESYLPIASIGWDTDHITGIRQHITSDMIFMFTYQFFANPDTWRAAWGPIRPSNVM